MARDDDPEGVGGWLALFLVTLGVFHPAIVLFYAWNTGNNAEVAAAYGDVWSTLLPADWLLAGARAALCWFAVARFLWVRNWRTVRIGVVTLWVICFVGVIGHPLMVSLIAGIPLDQLYSSMFGLGLFRPVIYSTIWTLYLLRSERVARTYPRESAAGVAEVFD